MILDSSALIALIFKEPGHEQMMDKLTEIRISGNWYPDSG